MVVLALKGCRRVGRSWNWGDGIRKTKILSCCMRTRLRRSGHIYVASGVRTSEIFHGEDTIRS